MHSSSLDPHDTEEGLHMTPQRKDLSKKRVAILATDGFEDVELGVHAGQHT